MPLEGVLAGVVNVLRAVFRVLFARRPLAGGSVIARLPPPRAAGSVRPPARVMARSRAPSAAGARSPAIASSPAMDQGPAGGKAALIGMIDAGMLIDRVRGDAAATAAGTAVTHEAADAAAPAVRDGDPAAGGSYAARPRARKAMNQGFDMPAEIARLAERVIEPLAARLSAQELAQITGEIRDAFERLDVRRAAAGARFEAGVEERLEGHLQERLEDRANAEDNFAKLAAAIVEPVEPRFSQAERCRMVDRLSGAMTAFAQGVGQA